MLISDVCHNYQFNFKKISINVTQITPYKAVFLFKKHSYSVNAFSMQTVQTIRINR